MKSTPKDVELIVRRICPLLTGHSPELQGAVLADLVAMFLAGYQGPDADGLRAEMLQLHIETVRALIPLNEKLQAARSANP